MDTFLPYLLGIIGFLIVHVLNGIKSEISSIKTQISKIEGDLHGRVTDIEHRQQDQINDVRQRVATIEARCEEHHK